MRSATQNIRLALRPWLAVMAAFGLSFAFVGFLAFIGYFGGPVFSLTPANTHRDAAAPGLAAVFLSGDMGFRVGMGPQIANRLADNGIPVIGVNSLVFFRNRRSPAENRALIAEATRRALALPGIDRVALIGQSFGADMLQAGLPGLNEASRKHVTLVALVVPGDTVIYRASPQAMLSLNEPETPALPTARRLDWVPAVCIQGKLERSSLCPQLHQTNVWHVELPGGHMLDRDAGAVGTVLLRAIACAVRDVTCVSGFAD
ncbi:AcvB/VirJ family lysyl-phosphatidylglycerol hydrolase [Sphingomonas sp. M1-B02]|uniref:AcvB/VirJ family lysyl-phosphatidylglycerol hydrolase n=1 Tax=Sphingomonas sp. M1-B02 TaxID=3114300 RepID=UPI0022403E94|nr:AcvB/VirJ family lysyl-phosphatidylglycerol hydrolase [Sphingomonas sp. S6-11]UZK66293.1 virulence factor [Sphingomonas sp. S6-11]